MRCFLQETSREVTEILSMLCMELKQYNIATSSVIKLKTEMYK